MVRRTSNRKEKMTGWLAAVLITAVLMACLMVTGIMASEKDRMPDLEAGAQGSLKVTMTYTDPNLETDNVKVMPDVQVKLACVASLEVNGGSADYTLLDAYRSTGIELTGMTAADSHTAAERLVPLTVAGDVVTGTTAHDGTVTFQGLEPGMYLVFQDAEANTAYRVDAIATFLVPVPYPLKSEGGNAWEYEVGVQPKTELPGPRNNGVIRVTKQLFNTETQLAYNPPENEELVFYVGLFMDEACTVRAAGTTDLPLRFLNSDTAEAVFENLETDATYYIAETDGNGTVVPSALKGEDVLFEALYPQGQTVSITRQAPEGAITFQNATTGLPFGYYYGGTLTITKKTVMDGVDYETDDTFYAGLFTDENFRTRYGDVIELKMDGSSSFSVPLEVNIGTSENDSATYYVTETDKNGRPIGAGGQEFTMSVNKAGGKVTLSPAEPDDEVVITNSFTEAGSEITEISTENVEVGSSNSNGNLQNPRTGDSTPLLKYVLLMAAALGVLLGGLRFRRRYRR